eukprot:Mrub_06795.p1 GENE.Mrub_06795~~Mrub_06795.p1  ORF type:complete len:241 (-),score=28.29 Mrub_06795:254-976(-)
MNLSFIIYEINKFHYERSNITYSRYTSKIEIDYGRKMTSAEFLAWHHFEPQKALKHLTDMIQQYIEYDVQNFLKNHRADFQKMSSQLSNEELSDSVKNAANKYKSKGHFIQKRQFKEYLSKQPGFENMYPYLWDDLKDFGTQLLNESTDVEMSESLFKKIEELEPKISELKSKYGLKSEDTDTLRKIEGTHNLNSEYTYSLISYNTSFRTSLANTNHSYAAQKRARRSPSPSGKQSYITT